MNTITKKRLPVEDHAAAGEPPGSVCNRGAVGFGGLGFRVLGFWGDFGGSLASGIQAGRNLKQKPETVNV